MTAVLLRLFLGAASGAVVGFVVFLFYVRFTPYDPYDDGTKWRPFLGVASALGACLGVFAGKRELHGKTKSTVTGALLGCLVVLVFTAGLAAFEPEPRSRTMVDLRWLSIILGIPVAILLGGCIGFRVGLRREETGGGDRSTVGPTSG